MSDPDARISRWNTGYAGLVLGFAWLKTERLLRVLNHIPLLLKTVKRSPRSKLEDLLVCLMAGVESLGQINSSLRYDWGLALAVGRESLALLTVMANLELVWFRRALGSDDLGIKRFIRDVIKTPGIVTSGRSGIGVEIEAEVKYFQLLNNWKPQIDLPLFPSGSGGILYKN